MKAQLFSLGAATIMLLSSCDGVTGREFSIENNIGTSITVQVVDSGNDTLNFPIGANKTGVILYLETRGGESDPGEPTDFIPNLLIYSATDSATIAFEEKELWRICSDHQSKTPSSYVHTFLLKVNESDFE